MGSWESEPNVHNCNVIVSGKVSPCQCNKRIHYITYVLLSIGTYVHVYVHMIRNECNSYR